MDCCSYSAINKKVIAKTNMFEKSYFLESLRKLDIGQKGPLEKVYQAK